MLLSMVVNNLSHILGFTPLFSSFKNSCISVLFLVWKINSSHCFRFSRCLRNSTTMRFHLLLEKIHCVPFCNTDLSFTGSFDNCKPIATNFEIIMIATSVVFR